MAILGKIDRRPLLVTVEVQADTNGDPRQVVIVGGDFTDDTTDNYVEPGDILEIADVPYVVYPVTNATTLQLKRDAVLGAGQAAARRTPPKEVADYVNASGDSFVGDLLCVSLAEAQDPGSRARGITGPGWWYYKTFTDVAGNTRHKAECIASFKIAGGTAGVVNDDTLLDDATTAEDTVAGQDDAIITIDALLPADVPGATEAIGTASFTIQPGAISTPPADATLLTFQWQRKAAGGRWTNLAAETGDTLNLTGLTVADNHQDQYRVKVNSTNGAPEVVSRAATLTVTLT